jgi:hypothetical protein
MPSDTYILWPDHHDGMVYGDADVIHRAVRHVGGCGVHPVAETLLRAHEEESSPRLKRLRLPASAHTEVRFLGGPGWWRHTFASVTNTNGNSETISIHFYIKFKHKSLQFWFQTICLRREHARVLSAFAMQFCVWECKGTLTIAVMRKIQFLSSL